MLRLPCTTFWRRGNFKNLQRFKYSSEATTKAKLKISRDPEKPYVGEITLANGIQCSLNFARLPLGGGEPAIACLLWDVTTAALPGAPGIGSEPMPRPSAPNLYNLGPSSLAGQGMFAARDIAPGETILVERPLLMAASQTPSDAPTDPAEYTAGPWSAMPKMILHTLGEFLQYRISESDQAVLQSFSSSDKSTLQKFLENAVMLDTMLPGQYKGLHSLVGREILKINHSCAPNVDLSWSPKSLSLSVTSIAPILEGEEIFMAYENHHIEPRHERQRWLRWRFRFDCRCPSCVLPEEESLTSDENRRFIAQDFENVLMDVSQGAMNGDDPGMVDWLRDRTLPEDHLIARSEKIIELMDKEGCGLVLHRVFHYRRLQGAYAALGEAGKMRHWAARMVALGRHPEATRDVDKSIRALANVRVVGEWEHRKRPK
ncbi:hypothetical protein C8F01DRAFT_29802 [Mycena amicta]|nr:hypothetical protein C8F01DRAFT_29802 [Mycena amicta]